LTSQKIIHHRSRVQYTEDGKFPIWQFWVLDFLCDYKTHTHAHTHTQTHGKYSSAVRVTHHNYIS